MLRATLLGALAATAGALEAPPVPVELRIEAGRGRCTLDGRVFQVEAGRGTHTLAAEAYLELGPTAVAHVRWGSFATLRVRGGAALAVEPLRPGEEGPLGRATLYHLGSADLELRRGTLWLDLPGGWTLELGRAAVFLRQLVDGRVELQHRGGAELRVRSRVERRGSGERTLRPGARLLLEPPASLIPHRGIRLSNLPGIDG